MPPAPKCLQKLLYGRMTDGEGALKGNREVFRRAVPREFGSVLAPVRLSPEPRVPRDVRFTPTQAAPSPLPWAALAAVVLAGTLLAAAAIWLL